MGTEIVEIVRGSKVNYRQSLGCLVSRAKNRRVTDEHKGVYRDIKGTYVWAILSNVYVSYIIEHPQGHPAEFFFAGIGKEDGVGGIHSSLLDKRKRYVYADLSELTINND